MAVAGVKEAGPVGEATAGVISALKAGNHGSVWDSVSRNEGAWARGSLVAGVICAGNFLGKFPGDFDVAALARVRLAGEFMGNRRCGVGEWERSGRICGWLVTSFSRFQPESTA
jgi:hypothetical protein